MLVIGAGFCTGSDEGATVAAHGAVYEERPRLEHAGNRVAVASDEV